MRRKYSQLRRNPLVRLIRWVRKLVVSLFKPQRSSRRLERFDREDLLDLDLPETSTGIAESNNFRPDRLITVGELFAQVEWKFDRTTAQTKSVPTSTTSVHLHDVSQN
jgi:hypothetical protein